MANRTVNHGMQRVRRTALQAVAAALLAVTGCAALGTPGAGAAPRFSGVLPFGCANPAGHRADRLLPAAVGSVRTGLTCFGHARLSSGSLTPHAAATGPAGYGPHAIRSAYRLLAKNARGRVVALVDAYDDPKAEADLAAYRTYFGLPPCTTANGCFRKVNQYGAAAPLPAPDYGWAEETSLDLDAVSAACPSCHILLVEANSPSVGPLMTAVDTAARLGAIAIANSYGGREDGTILTADRHLRHRGVAITAASGDTGYGVQWPASSPSVTAVGGTTLRPANNARGWTETAWPSAGSGCSRYEPKPAWQHDTGCRKRTVADVAAVANPATGLAVYDTFNSCVLPLLCDALIRSGAAQGLNGWAQVGGTSLAAPIVAAIYALAGNHRGVAYAYAHRTALNDVRSGANGSCATVYLCRARAGYDGPTGLGTPNGTGAF